VRVRVDWSDAGVRTALAFGLPMLVAVGVLVWGFVRTENHMAVPDPNVAPIFAVSPDGRAVPIAPTPRPATPTPGLQPGTAYRLEGIVVDVMGAPIPDVCIAIGPNGCQPHSPKTDERGVYFIDFPEATVSYDLHFTKDGYKEVVQRLQPTQNQVLNLVLAQ
jgi:hypothetical protein